MIRPKADELAALLREVKTIAIVGAKDVMSQPVGRVGAYLLDAGYTLIPVHPVRRSAWGIPCVARLEDIEVPVDLVNLFRASPSCPEHAREVLRMKHRPRCFWMQTGIASPKAREILAGTGILVIEDACIMVEHRRFLGPDLGA